MTVELSEGFIAYETELMTWDVLVDGTRVGILNFDDERLKTKYHLSFMKVGSKWPETRMADTREVLIAYIDAGVKSGEIPLSPQEVA